MSDEAKRQVLEATDIVGLIGEQVALTPRGREFIGLCPFHDDHKPSMNVVPAKQLYKCFACGAGGDVFSFVMDYHKMTFPEALEHLADRANIKLPRRGGGGERDGADGSASPRRLILEANEKAAGFYRHMLTDARHGEIARRYLAERGVSDSMIEAFGIGYAPDAWDALARRAAAERWPQRGLELAGLLAPRQTGEGCFDRLRHRLIFPIRDSVGRTIAFGGRTLPGGSGEHESKAKYLNSPEHAAFNKSAVLFGLDLAHKPIIDARTAIIVEGYTDVIACHQAAVRNAVATLGTALTRDHARTLRRYADRVVLIFDADEAGQKAAERALGVFFAEPIDIEIAVLPDGLDPADLLANDGGLERWREALGGAVDAMTFQFNRLRRAFDRSDSMSGRQRLTEDYLRTLVQLGLRQLDRRRYGLVFARIAELLGITPGGVSDVLGRIAPRKRPAGPAAPAATPHADPATEEAAIDDPYGDGTTPEPPVPPGAGCEDDRPLHAIERAERHAIGCILNNPALFHADLPDGRAVSETLLAGEFTHPANRRLYHAISEWLLDHEGLDAADLREAVTEEPLVRLALDARIEADRLSGGDDRRLEELFTASASAVAQQRAERDYEQRKQEIRGGAGADADRSPDDEAARRLELAIAHMSAHPSARRMPRPIG